MNKLYLITFICGLLLLGADVSVADFSDDFEDGTINTSIWITGGDKRGWRTDIPPGVGNWNYDDPPEEIVDSNDGYLKLRVWGPMSGNTYGAEAWVRTKHDFNDGKSYLINFTWEPEFIDWHYNYYYLQITDGYIPVYGNVHWANEYDDPGTVNLLRQLEPGGSLSRGWHYQNSPPVGKLNYSITIDQAGIVKLYDAPNEGGTLLREEPLDPGSPWYIRFMTIDATSSGFPSGECRLNLYDFSAVSECPPPPSVPPWSFVHITDTHIGPQKASDSLCAARHYIKNHLSPMPAFVLVTGDISHVGCSNVVVGCPLTNYRDFTNIMDSIGIPYYTIPGNHDRRIILGWCQNGLGCYESNIDIPQDTTPLPLSGTGNYWFEKNGYLFIGLDTGGKHSAASDHLTNEQMGELIWLGNNNKCKPKIVFMHHPAVATDHPNQLIGNMEIVNNREQFLNWCQDNDVRVVIQGHRHNDEKFDRNEEEWEEGIETGYVVTPSCGKGDRGFRIFNVNGGIVSASDVIDIQDILAGRLEICKHSPVELHLYDSQGRHVEIDPSSIVEGEIPGSYSFPKRSLETEDGSESYPDKIIIFEPTDDYLYELIGTEGGTYGLDITLASGGEETTFEAAEIPTLPGAKHVYAVDWQALSAGEEGVILNIDNNGDGFFEQMVIADDQLSYDEFALQTETVVDFDPDTLNLNSEGKFATVYIELPEDFDVSEIDLFSLALNELVPPLPKPIEIGDYDSDGTNDLMVKFDIQELIEVLEPGEQMIDLTGRLWDGRPIAGFDFIRVIH